MNARRLAMLGLLALALAAALAHANDAAPAVREADKAANDAAADMKCAPDASYRVPFKVCDVNIVGALAAREPAADAQRPCARVPVCGCGGVP